MDALSPQDAVAPLLVDAKTRPQDARQMNRRLIFQTLLRRAPVSRADLARETRLSRPTVSRIVAELEDEGIVEELGAEQTVSGRRGKKGTLVDLHSGNLTVIVIDLSSTRVVSGAVVDVRGRVHLRRQVALDGARGEDVVDLTATMVQTLRAGTDQHIAGVGIAAPGIIDDAGVVQIGTRLGLYDVPLAANLQERTGLAVFAVNDSRAAARGVAIAHHVEGDDASRRGLLVVTLDDGVGAGVIVGGALVSGTHAAAGEIGHLIADEDGPACECGRRGCLEAMISAPRLRARVAEAGAATRGEILDRAGRALGHVLAPVVNVLDLGEVVLCGPPDVVDRTLVRATIAALRDRQLAIVSQDVAVTSRGETHELILLGAAAFVLSRVAGI